jgi:hypothetical protein
VGFSLGVLMRDKAWGEEDMVNIGF